MPVSTTDYDLFTSFRYDPKLLTAQFNTAVNGIELPYLLFAYHIDRLVATATHFGWQRALQAVKAPGAPERIRDICNQAVMDTSVKDKEKGLGLRLILTKSGELRVEAHPTRPLTGDPLLAASINPLTTPPSRLPSLIITVYIDTLPTPATVFTSYKTTARAHYDAARARRGIKDRHEPREVLLHNERGEIMEGSVRNVAFWRGGDGEGTGGWITPPARSGGLPGTVRRYLLERGMMKEGVIKVSDVKVGEYVLLCNGWDGTVLGRVVGD